VTFYEAALQILKSSREPLTTREITERALENGLIVSRGKTPVATMGAELYGRLDTDASLSRSKIAVRLAPSAEPCAGRSAKHETLPAERGSLVPGALKGGRVQGCSSVLGPA
jgi:hypothetical protein